MLTSQAITHLRASALNIRMMSATFGSHPLAPAALLVAKFVLLVIITYVVWSGLKWF
ncbi:hypothetical protein [Aliidiomarina soli]|uniref:hypothetical protein n=1 Tax=Aliidiomarina soli TaxID=1928574 RepID=UPI0013002653|nr:hypothetical protein [Aliidiomarina soli]